MTDKKIEELLPWHVNETLDDVEAREVEEFLVNNPDAQADVEFLRTVRRTLKNESVQSPGELGLKRFQRQLKADSKPKPSPSTWWRPALAAAAVVIVVQGGLLMNLWQQPDPTYAPLGGAPASGPVLQVQFHETATEANIRAAINAVEGTIVDGPGIGVYRIRLSPYVLKSGLDAAVKTMSENTQVVKHVSKE